MNKVLVIIPYFGKLPNWFQVFLNSCRNTKILDFLLITDDESNYIYPDNFIVKYVSFQNIQEHIKKMLGPNSYIEHPYKLCDYKSLYGYLFQDDIANYAFWAHSDIDLVFGDIDTILNSINYTEFDRVFPYGHFSIYRNSEKINMLFREKLPDKFPEYFDINFVRRTTYPCHFDEIGMNIIVKYKDLPFLEGKRHINTNLNYYNYSVGDGKHNTPCIIVYNEGKVLTVEKDNDTFITKEFLYVHIQGKKIIQNLIPQTNKYIICRDGFIDYEDDKNNLYFSEYGLNDNEEKQLLYTEQVRKNLKKVQKEKLLRELREYPLRSIYNIYHRFMSILYLKRNNLF